VIAVRDRVGEFGDAVIAVVTFAKPNRLAAHQAHLAVPFTLLADEKRSLYELLGAQRGSRRQVWSAGTIRMYVRLLRQGRRLQRTTEDVQQLGADAIVGRDGTLRYLSLPSTPDARPSVDELLVQHSLLDPMENRQLVKLLPRAPKRT
jgi:peroxiredoxin